MAYLAITSVTIDQNERVCGFVSEQIIGKNLKSIHRSVHDNDDVSSFDELEDIYFVMMTRLSLYLDLGVVLFWR